MKSFFGYIRVSTAKQGERGSSLQEQKSAIEAYAARHELPITEWYEERETAAKQGRPMFSRLLSALDTGAAQGVIIHKIDRSARNLKDWANLLDLIERGIELHFAHESIDLNSRGGRLSADIQAVVAADFIRNLREETRKGFYGRLKQGLFPLAAPIGYLDCGSGKPKTIDPVQGPLMQTAFTLYASGDMNLKELQIELYKRGLRNRTGGRVSKNTLSYMLNNPFYIGVIHLRKTNETFVGIHQPLISKQLYDQVQSVLAGKRNGKSKQHDHLFRRRIRCTTCNQHLVGEIQKGRYSYYRCHSPGCHVCIPERTIHELLRDVLSSIVFDPEELRDVRDMVEDLKHNDEHNARQREASLRLRLASSHERLARLTDALIDGLIDKEAFEERRKTLLLHRTELSEQLNSKAAWETLSDRIEKNLELANTAYVSYENGYQSEKRSLLDAMTSNFTGSGKEPEITLVSPFHEVLNLKKNPTSCPHRDEPRTRAKKVFEIMVQAAEGEMAAFTDQLKRAV